MKNVIKIGLLLLAMTFTACNSNQGNKKQGSGKNSDNFYKAIISTPISETQKADLLFMWEEEKMARDVYSTLGAQYNDDSFLRIKSSEQSHMNSVKYLLDQLNIVPPVAEAEVGHFFNPDIQNLFNTLIARGQYSLPEAYQVGYDIEVVDIADLVVRLNETTDPGIRSVYEKLISASEKHKSAFSNKL